MINHNINNCIRRVLLYIVIISLIIGFWPLKLAKDPQKYIFDSNEYIICTETRVTGCNWSRIIETKENNSTILEDFNFLGKSPLDSIYNLDISNSYVVYGEQLEFPIEDVNYENVKYTCNTWEILYPIKRQNILSFLLPKRYLCLWDVIEKFLGWGWIVFILTYWSFILVYCFINFVMFLKKSRGRFCCVNKREKTERRKDEENI